MYYNFFSITYWYYVKRDLPVTSSWVSGDLGSPAVCGFVGCESARSLWKFLGDPRLLSLRSLFAKRPRQRADEWTNPADLPARCSSGRFRVPWDRAPMHHRPLGSGWFHVGSQSGVSIRWDGWIFLLLLNSGAALRFARSLWDGEFCCKVRTDLPEWLWSFVGTGFSEADVNEWDFLPEFDLPFHCRDVVWRVTDWRVAEQGDRFISTVSNSSLALSSSIIPTQKCFLIGKMTQVFFLLSDAVVKFN